MTPTSVETVGKNYKYHQEKQVQTPLSHSERGNGEKYVAADGNRETPIGKRRNKIWRGTPNLSRSSFVRSTKAQHMFPHRVDNAPPSPFRTGPPPC